MAFPFAAAAAGAGALGSMFGGDDEGYYLDPRTKFFLQMMKRGYRQTKRDSKAAPLSLPQERMALAMDRGLAGEQLQSERERMYAAMGPENAGNVGDAMAGLAAMDLSVLNNIDTQHLLASLGMRQDLKYNVAPRMAAAGAAASPSPQASQGGPDLAGLLSNLAYQSSFGKASRGSNGSNGGGTGIQTVADTTARVRPTGVRTNTLMDDIRLFGDDEPAYGRRRPAPSYFG